MVRNDSRRYGAISIALHWAGAATILTMLGSGLMMALASDRASYLPWVKFHSSLGMTLWLLLAARIVWHFVETRPRPLSDHLALNRVASGVHIVMLLSIASQLVTGPFDVWTGGFPLSVFGLFTMPSPLGNALRQQHDAIGVVHAYVGLAIGCLAALHLAGVAKHVLIDRDGTLGRMFGLTPREDPSVSS